MSPNTSNDFLNRELDNLRVQTSSMTTPAPVEANVLNAFMSQQRAHLKTHVKTHVKTNPKEKLHATPRRGPTWFAAFTQWAAPVTAVAASVVMSAWISLGLLLPGNKIPPNTIANGALPINGMGAENNAPFFALRSLEQISLEPNPQLIETRIPKMMLASMGITVPPEMAAESLRAEMLVSAAGQPLALRFSQR